MSRILLLQVQDAERRHDHTMAPEDRTFLIETLVESISRRIDKFVRGAKKHRIPLVERVSFADVDAELDDAAFYNAAMRRKLIIVTHKEVYS